MTANERLTALLARFRISLDDVDPDDWATLIDRLEWALTNIENKLRRYGIDTAEFLKLPEEYETDD